MGKKCQASIVLVILYLFVSVEFTAEAEKKNAEVQLETSIQEAHNENEAEVNLSNPEEVSQMSEGQENSPKDSSDSVFSEPFLFSVELDYSMALMPPQSELFGPGASSSVAFYYPVLSWLLLGSRLQGTFLSDGAPPKDSGRADPDYGSFFSLSGEVRFRPLATFEEPKRATGLWLGVEGGGGISGTFKGGSWRGFYGLGVGWGFAWESVSLGPVVRFIQVIEPGAEIAGKEDAYLLSAGLEFVFNDARQDSVKKDSSPELIQNDAVDLDRDGIFAPEDQCIDEPEDHDGFEDDDGCPEDDNDADGLADQYDSCPFEAEDGDHFEDDDGCPDVDNDLDGIFDTEDWCPFEAEVVNGVDDEDGCPDEGLIEFTEDRIIIDDRVLFDLERARVKSKAKPVIQAIIRLWKQHKEWQKIRIEGHSDVRGNPEYNLSLSKRRAKNVVKALVAAGMKKSLLEHEGYGSLRPRFQEGEVEDAHSRNRRVEFIVIRKSRVSELDKPSSQKQRKKTTAVRTRDSSTIVVDQEALDDVDRWGEHLEDFVDVNDVVSSEPTPVDILDEEPLEQHEVTSNQKIETEKEVKEKPVEDTKEGEENSKHESATEDEWDEPFDEETHPEVKENEKKSGAPENSRNESDEWEDPFEE